MSKSINTQIAEIDAKIVKLQARRAELADKSEAAAFEPEAGAVLSFSYGRKDPVTLTGTVLGIKRPEEGKPGGTFVVFQTGEGADTKVLTVPVGDVQRPAQAE
jgi:hypothetical protein